MLVIDIETGPLPDDQLRAAVAPFTPPPHPGEFDPSSVKYGNLGEAKRAEKLQQAQADHATLVSNYAANVKQAEADWWADVVNRAALDPTTGRVLCIGYYSAETKAKVIDGGLNKDGVCGHASLEVAMLTNFWNQYGKMRTAGRKIVGCNILNFDIPFLARRSWILGVDVPATVRSGRYLDPIFCDLMEAWLLGQRLGQVEAGLGAIGRALGLGGKAKLNGTPDGQPASGADFHKYWFGTPEQRKEAEAYLVRDLELTKEVADRLGVV